MSVEIDYTKIGKRIRSARKERKMKQEEVALACKCSSNHLSAVENGDNKPSLELLIRLANVLDSSVDYFLMDTEHANPKFLINCRIAPKLENCSTQDLQLIEHLIDEVLKYKSMLLADR